MTTTIKVTSHNYPALVTATDTDMQGEKTTAFEQVVHSEDGEQQFYCTTSRVITVTDLEYDDPRAVRKSESVSDIEIVESGGGSEPSGQG